MKQIAAALLKAQKEMGNATKDSKNPFFKSSYADLNAIREACMPSLNANGIVVLQPTVTIEGKNYVKTVLLHESGETFESLTEIIYSKINDAQSQGSGITYARRYGLQSLVNVGAEDDDGNKASNNKPIVDKITPTQISIIEGLMQTSTLNDTQLTFIQKNMMDCTQEQATKWIENLKGKQVDAIEAGNSYTQTDIKNKLKTIK
jgi:hypothetical protein